MGQGYHDKLDLSLVYEANRISQMNALAVQIKACIDLADQIGLGLVGIRLCEAHEQLLANSISIERDL